MLVLAGSQIVDVPEGAELDTGSLGEFLAHGQTLGLDNVPEVRPQGISLNVTSACNLGCSYCYADRGRFAGRQKAQQRLAELLTQLDANGDGRVSRAEFVEGPTPLFDRADTDHDGELSRDEVAAAKAKIAQLRGT